jgi:hypothetical protein
MPPQERQAAARRAVSLAFVCWDDTDGSEVQGPPLPVSQAEALAHAFACYWPERAYVVKPLTWPGREAERNQ